MSNFALNKDFHNDVTQKSIHNRNILYAQIPGFFPVQFVSPFPIIGCQFIATDPIQGKTVHISLMESVMNSSYTWIGY